MAEVQTAPYGSWKSPITTDMLASSNIRLGQPTLQDGNIYWVEMRPSEGGRNVLVRRAADGTTQDITPPPFNVRTRVHEYGGISYVVANGTVYFSNFADQRLYRQTSPEAAPEPITPAVDLRYTDLIFDAKRHRLIGIQEDHTQGGEAINTIAALPSPPRQPKPFLQLLTRNFQLPTLPPLTTIN